MFNLIINSINIFYGFKWKNKKIHDVVVNSEYMVQKSLLHKFYWIIQIILRQENIVVNLNSILLILTYIHLSHIIITVIYLSNLWAHSGKITSLIVYVCITKKLQFWQKIIWYKWIVWRILTYNKWYSILRLIHSYIRVLTKHF